jgi:hypothetical protein
LIYLIMLAFVSGINIASKIQDGFEGRKKSILASREVLKLILISDCDSSLIETICLTIFQSTSPMLLRCS